MSAQLNELSRRRWEDYGFDPDDAEARYNLRDVTKGEAEALGFANASDGILIAYPDRKDDRIRWRPTGFGAQTVGAKYGQRAHTLPALYYPPTLSAGWRENSSLPILITEGEFKAMVVDTIVNQGRLTSVVPCAVGGVFSWQSSKNGIDLIADLAGISWMGRTVYFAFDMDQNTNPMVSLALSRFVNKLGEHGAIPRVLQWPAPQGKGIDDYLCSNPMGYDSWLDMLSKAQFPAHIVSVMEMNDRFAYCEVQQQVYDIQNATYIAPRSFSSDFFTRSVRIQTGVRNGAPVLKDIPIGEYWMKSPLRSTCVNIRFVPGQPRVTSSDGGTYINTWPGWGQGLRGKPLVPVKGDVEPFMEFLRATFSNEDPAHVDYLLKRIAWMFKQPERKHPTWIYLMGRPLQGKSTLLKIISQIMGVRYVANVDESIVRGQFAEWRAEKLMVTFDDSSISDPRVVRQLLKRLTTEENSQVNLKYVKAQTAENYFTFVFVTNGVEALLDHDDRRALVLEADCPWDYAKGEWERFDKWRSDPKNLQALLHYFLETPIPETFYNAVPPKTRARELIVEVGESNWDETINYFSMSKGNIHWPVVDDKHRSWKPTVFTIDMIRHIHALRNGTDDKMKATAATITGKLVRYGARRCSPEGHTDSRGRVSILGQQVAFWTWDYTWLRASREALSEEFFKLRKSFPELFPSASKGKY